MNMGDSHLLVDILKSHFGPHPGPQVGVEVGTHRGGLSSRLLHAFPNLNLWMVDSWTSHKPDSRYYESGDSVAKLTAAQQNECRLEAERATAFAKSRRTVLWLPSNRAVNRIPNPRIDWAFIDGSHVYEDAAEDLAIWWPRVTGGPGRPGLMAMHDYNHPRNDSGRFGVRRAVDEFVEREGLELSVTGSIAWVVRGRFRAADPAEGEAAESVDDPTDVIADPEVPQAVE